MKTKYIATILFVMFLTSNTVFAQKSKVEIQTSAQCEMCKGKIEKELVLTAGIKSADLDLETKIVTIEFKEKKINVDEIKYMISNLGYDADEVEANPEKYEQLPNCCKKP